MLKATPPSIPHTALPPLFPHPRRQPTRPALAHVHDAVATRRLSRSARGWPLLQALKPRVADTMRCAACNTDKAPEQFANGQKRKPARSRRCSGCTAAASGSAAAHVEADASAEPEASRSSEAAATAAAEPRVPAAAVPPTAERVCAWTGCGRALLADTAGQSRCGRCKKAFYCGRTCQKRHWGRGDPGFRLASCMWPSCAHEFCLGW